MKVFIITNIAFPYGMAPANRIRCYAKALSSAGIDAEVLVYRRTERYGISPQNTQAQGECEGVCFRYITGTPLRGSNVLIRQLQDRIDKIRLLFVLKQELQCGDIIFLYNGFDVEFNILLTYFAHCRGNKVAVDLCELPYGTGAETKIAKKKRAKVTGRLYPQIDGIISISDALRDYASPYLNKDCRMIKIPIMVDYDYYFLEDKSAEEIHPFIFHSGTLTEQKDGILGMIEAFGIACRNLPEKVRFICTGRMESSPHCREIETLIEKYSLQNRLLFIGYLSETELREYLKRASLVIINKYRTQQNKYCFSTKLGEYMAAGKTVIITDVGEAMHWLADGHDAYVVEAENNEELAKAISRCFTEPTVINRLGSTARETCRKSFDYKRYSEILRSFFIGLVC